MVPLENIAYSYGYGVYETIRVNKGTIYFANEHLDRLQESSHIIGIEHNYSNNYIKKAIEELIFKNKSENCNLKIILIGGYSEKQAQLYILCLNPLYPDRKLYQTGAKLITYEAERPFPHAKSLNMLQSFLAYKLAKANDAYDALLINSQEHITEGTRTNFFVMKGKVIVTPPDDDILLGVMRKVVLKVAKENDYAIQNDNITHADLDNYDSAFVTSTSSKVMPVSTIDNYTLEVSAELKNLIQKTNAFLEMSDGKLD